MAGVGWQAIDEAVGLVGGGKAARSQAASSSVNSAGMGLGHGLAGGQSRSSDSAVPVRHTCGVVCWQVPAKPPLRKYEEFCGSMQAHKPARNRRHLYPPRKSRHRASGGDRLRGLRNGSRQLLANNHSHGGNACASPALSSTSHRLQLCQAAPGGLKLRKLIWPTGRADRRGNHTKASRPRAPTPSSASPGPP